MPLFPAYVVKISGITIFYNTSVSLEWPDNDTDVDTIPGGAQGVAPGADKCTATLENAVPVAGADIDLVKAKKNRTELPCEFRQIGSSKKTAGMFLCRSVTISSGVGQPTMYNATLQSVGVVPEVA